MAFLVKKNNFLDLNKTKSQKFTHQSGLELTLKSIFTPNFQKAWDAIGTIFEKASEKPLTGALIASISDDTLTRGQATTHAIAEFLIDDWNAVDENEEKLPINADNLFQVVANIPEDSLAKLPSGEKESIFDWIFKSSSEVAKSIAETIDTTKKKPSNATSGKKSTEA